MPLTALTTADNAPLLRSSTGEGTAADISDIAVGLHFRSSVRLQWLRSFNLCSEPERKDTENLFRSISL
ncbi:hypothetical protein RRG08_032277 [Elysia crispata]|uniref:Uncharacterized protein n=1 Tax=Elysia crispata TaxID=231223 RepID=A0AAE1ASM1_9GAST|nr:hypothetical protein RRG08_032277 [Elysia crispata]